MQQSRSDPVSSMELEDQFLSHVSSSLLKGYFSLAIPHSPAGKSMGALPSLLNDLIQLTIHTKSGLMTFLREPEEGESPEGYKAPELVEGYIKLKDSLEHQSVSADDTKTTPPLIQDYFSSDRDSGKT